MILIVSNNADWSTNDVLEWLEAKGARYERLNYDSLSNATCEICLDEGFSSNLIKIEGRIIDSNQINMIWFRRTAKPFSVDIQNLKTAQNDFGKRLSEFIESELKYFNRAILHALGSNKKWLNNFLYAHNDKLETLQKAQYFELDIPATCQTFSKTTALKFINKYGLVVMKPIYNIDMFMIDGQMFMPYTKRVTEEDFINLNEKIFPVLLQEEIKKEFEVRSFFLDGQFYSMAIFSQQSEQTQVDFRKYNYIKPNRRVSFKLPGDIEKKLSLLMDALNLNSGSIDLLKTTDGRYVFLEVNPVGQFGMVSYPCNYYLEEKIADFLITYQ